MKLFGIRHIPSGKFMPATMGNGMSRGWTNWDPTLESAEVYTPRLFVHRASASKALSAWLTGVYVRSTGRTSGTPDSPPEYYDDVEVFAPEVPRVRAEMEVVAFEASEVPA